MTAPGWPPPASTRRDWTKRDFPKGQGREVVRVRQVLLWGRLVWINEALDVWCPACLRWRTVRELGAPRNRCPVGIVRPSGTVTRYDSGDPAQDGPDQTRRQGHLNLMRTPW